MADNSTLPATGDIIASDDIAGVKYQRIKLVYGVDGVNSGDVATANPLPINMATGFVSSVNSTAALLGINGVFTGVAEDVTDYADARITVFSDQPSATDGLQIQQSSNGTNWDIIDSYSILAGTGKTFSIGVSTKFVRVVYTNGGTAQTAFRLQSKYQKTYSKGSSVRPQDGRGNDNDMEEETSHLMGYNGVSWDRLRASIANGLAVDVSRIVGPLPTGSNTLGTVVVSNMVAQGITDAQIRATPLPVTMSNTLALTDAQLRATPVPVSAIDTTAAPSGITVLQNAISATGNGTSLVVTGYGTTVLLVTGTFNASVNFEASVDTGVTWSAISATQIGSGDIFSTITVPGLFRITSAGVDLIRARVTWTSGTSITINGRSSNAVNASKIIKLASGTNSIGTVVVSNMVTQGLTDAQLRATAVPVSMATAPTTPVTGTFFQTTQPVSMATAPITPVTGSFFQATQPVSMATAPTTPVTGTFFQTTQPVSMATAPTTPVTGTFFQTTQPVSGAVSVTNVGVQAPSASIPVNLSNDVVVGAAGSIAALNIDLITGVASGWYDAANSHSVSIQVVGAAGITAGAIIFEQTNDTTVAAVGNVWAVDETTTLTPTPNITAITIVASTTRMFGGAVTARYVRVRVSTAFATANVQAVAVFSQMPYFRQVQTIHQATAASLNATVAGTVAITGYPTAAASADAFTNPTVTKVDATMLSYNGATWDRIRGMSTALTTGDTGAKTVTGTGATVTNVGNKGVQILVNMGVVTGTTPTAVFKVQGSTDAGTNWYDIPGAITASIISTGVFGVTIYPGIVVTAGVATTGTTATASMVIPRTWRVVWTLGGTTPSFTITNIQYIYLPN